MAQNSGLEKIAVPKRARERTFPALAVLLCAGCAGAPPAADPQFEAFLRRVDTAQSELQQGRPGAYEALWSHEQDVTLAGGFGGAFEQGWEPVSRRLEWASAQFQDGRNEIHRLAFASGGDIGYLVQTEHLVFHTPGQAATVERNYRVTMLFRREGGAWRIFHRHADSQNEKAAPR